MRHSSSDWTDVGCLNPLHSRSRTLEMQYAKASSYHSSASSETARRVLNQMMQRQ